MTHGAALLPSRTQGKACRTKGQEMGVGGLDKTWHLTLQVIRHQAELWQEWKSIVGKATVNAICSKAPLLSAYVDDFFCLFRHFYRSVITAVYVKKRAKHFHFIVLRWMKMHVFKNYLYIQRNHSTGGSHRSMKWTLLAYIIVLWNICMSEPFMPLLLDWIIQIALNGTTEDCFPRKVPAMYLLKPAHMLDGCFGWSAHVLQWAVYVWQRVWQTEGWWEKPRDKHFAHLRRKEATSCELHRCPALAMKSAAGGPHVCNTSPSFSTR